MLIRNSRLANLLALFVVTSCLSNAGMARANSVLITDYEVTADGKTLCTEAIQKSIDDCSASGGGTITFPAGQYLTGSLFLKDNVTLSLDAGAVLLGSTNLEDYQIHVAKVRSYTDNYVEKCLIYAEGVKNIGIIGRGTIDGQGEEPEFKIKSYKFRPYMIRMVSCKNVLIRDVTIVNSPMWVQHYLQCENLNIDGITVHSRVNWNNDGIDIDSCRRVRITNCNVSSLDDALVLKSTTPQPCSQISISNCTLSSHCNALKCGTESNGGFKDITVSNCTIYDTRLSGIALELVDGGTLTRVVVSGIAMSNVGNPLFIRLGNRARSHLKRESKESDSEGQDVEKPGVGALHDVIVSDVVASGGDSYGCPISGLPKHPIRGLVLRNLTFDFRGGGSQELAEREVPEREESYPEYVMFGPMPAYGLFVRHAEDVTLQNIRLTTRKADARPALVLDQVKTVDLMNVATGPENARLRTSQTTGVIDRDRVEEQISEPQAGLR